MSKNNNYAGHLRELLILANRPYLEELPFVCLTILLIGFPNSIPDIYDILATANGTESYMSAIGNASLLFLFAYFGAASVTCIKNTKIAKVWKYFLYTVCILINGTCHYLLYNFNLSISPTWFIMLAETTSNESKEFIGQYIFSDAMISTLKYTFIYVAGIVVFEKAWGIVKQKCLCVQTLRQRTDLGVLTMILLLFALNSTSIYWKIHNATSYEQIQEMNTPKDPFSSVYTTIVSLTMMGNNVGDAITLNKNVFKNCTAYTTVKDSLNIIVVIGESHIKYHSQLYGYELETNPNLAKEHKAGRLHVFEDVITSSNMTSIALRNILCCNNSGENELWHEYPSFLTIFKKAGYKIFFWDNQRDFIRQDNYPFTLKTFLYQPGICNICNATTNNTIYTYDGELINSFIKTTGIPNSKHNLILFHLIGQHHSAEDRYPKDRFNKFHSSDIKRDAPYLGEKEKAYIANYDNATLYNDHVIGNIIEYFKDKNTILVYFSDHGEEVYDYRNQCARDHGKLTADKLKYQYDIPFWVWCSDAFNDCYPNKVEDIKAATKRPMIIDNVCHMLFNAGGIECRHYREELDVISDKYQNRKRAINRKYFYEDIRYPRKP